MNPIKVAVGVIKNPSGQILISHRDKNLPQGGLWEFPGGKVEANETAVQALAREIKEELDLTINAATPLITINHQYADSTVQLHVFTVESYLGKAKGRENQPILWVDPENLTRYAFPAANQAIITAARLPPYYAILDDSEPSLLLTNLKTILTNEIKLIQARLKSLSFNEVSTFLEQAHPLCMSHKALLLLNSSVVNAEYLKADGLHLTSADLLACKQRPANKQWVAASCHNLEELRHAEAIGVDFIVLAPVLPTPTHPESIILGWDLFAELVNQTNLPVYALGGLSQAHLTKAQSTGAQGIAGIRAFL